MILSLYLFYVIYSDAINKNFNLACSLALINDYLLELRSFSITLINIKINYKLFIYFHTVTEYDIEVVFVYTLLVI